ncbi:pectate lyase [Kineococcus sp. NUM-3379]
MTTARTLAATCALALLAPLAATSAHATTSQATSAQATSAPAGPAHHGGRDLGRQVLGASDGWAAAGTGTTGGSAAAPTHDVTVRTWAELRAALGGAAAAGSTTPRIVRVAGHIDAHTAPDGRALDCDDYADPAYSHAAYRAAYDPATWGKADPSGPLEEARARSQARQQAQIRQNIGSNVTLVGVGKDARITGANLVVSGADNVIVRNLRLSDAYDCFPAWDPTDGSTGAWNAEYDNLWITGSTHVWVDHNTFDDGEHPPASLPTVFGVKFETQDGLLDVTNGADLVTASWNVFREHDKTLIIGNSDSRTTDRGKLRTTLHHNLFEGTGQRTPRVRFGQVHVYNNAYVNDDPSLFVYNLGVGRESQIVAENNAFVLAEGIDPAQVLRRFGGTQLSETGSVVVRDRGTERVDLAGLYNAANDPDLVDAPTWTPQHVEGRIDPATSVLGTVSARAGAGRLGNSK